MQWVSRQRCMRYTAFASKLAPTGNASWCQVISIQGSIDRGPELTDDPLIDDSGPVGDVRSYEGSECSG
jgi:hypothetical protein